MFMNEISINSNSEVTVGVASWWNTSTNSLLHQFTTTVGGTRCYLWLKQSQSNSLWFCSYLETEQSYSSWKATGYSKNRYPVTLQTNYGKLEKTTFFKLFVWPCNDFIRIDKILVYSILCATAWANWHRSLYSYIKQLPTVTRLCTVMKLVLCWTIAKCLP